jgi:predicted RNase H-like nuclease (RuvC/YqgF family)
MEVPLPPGATKPGQQTQQQQAPQQQAEQKKSTKYDSLFTGFNEQINNLTRRIRILEERYSNVRKKTQVTDQNMIEDVKNISTDIKLMNQDVDELKKQMNDFNEKTVLLLNEVKQSVKKHEFMQLEKYLNLWEPIQFLTYDQAVKLIKDYKENQDSLNKTQ